MTCDADYPKEPFHFGLLRAIWSHHLENPRRPAFMNADDESDYVTYGELYQMAHSIANFLSKNGIKKGDIGSIVLPNSWHYAAFFLGMASVGGATSGVSPIATEFELNRQFDDSKTAVILTDNQLLPVVKAATRNLTHVRVIIVVDANNNENFGNIVKRWSDVVACEPVFDLTSVHFDLANDLIALPYSSGTTGVPKGVMITHQNFNYLLSAMNKHNELYIYPFVYADVNFRQQFGVAFLPFYHAYGFYLLSGSMSRGITELIMKKFDFQLTLKLVEKYKILGLGCVPAIMVVLAKHPIVDKYDLSSLRVLSSGGSPLSKSLADEVMKRLPSVKAVVQGYGMTEVTCACHAARLNGEYEFGSVGHVIPGTECKIVNLSDQSTCKPGDKGELWIRGPQVMKGYFGKPKETAETVDKDGWLHTGDVVYEDQKGNLFICDRIKELIKVSSYQVPPAELEGIILTHPNVADAGVVGIPDQKHGELPRAYVVLKDKNGSLQEIADYVKGKVSHYKELKGGVESVELLPRTPAGKIMRRLLKEDYMKRFVNKSKL